MYHKIKDMLNVVAVMNEKAKDLHAMKYDSDSIATKDEIDLAVRDIQSLARQIANDTGEYVKISEGKVKLIIS